MGSLGPFHWTSAARSDVGLVRARNEDAYLDLPERGLWVVADGMGGHAVGDYASRRVVETLAVLPSHVRVEDRAAAARDHLQQVNRELRTEAVRRGVERIGSTVAVLLAGDARCICLWAGDSRIYRCRQGRLAQLTRDHSQAALSVGRTAPRPARNLITRAVGATDRLELDEEMVELTDGDLFLLCSDGLSNLVDEVDITALLLHGSCRQMVDALVELALERGGRDNVTAVVARAADLGDTDVTELNPML